MVSDMKKINGKSLKILSYEALSPSNQPVGKQRDLGINVLRRTRHAPPH